MASILDLYANDELQVLKEERLCQLQTHRKGRKARMTRETWIRERNDIVGEISLITDELEFRTTLSRAQNVRGLGFDD